MHHQALTTHCDTCWVEGEPARGLVAQVEGGQQRLPGGSYAYKLSLERKVSYVRAFPVPCGENWALRGGVGNRPGSCWWQQNCGLAPGTVPKGTYVWANIMAYGERQSWLIEREP